MIDVTIKKLWNGHASLRSNWIKIGIDRGGLLVKYKSDSMRLSVDVLKKLPNLPEVMDKANQALTFLASGQIPQNSNSYNELNIKKSEMITFRNQTIIGLLLLVIAGLLVF